MYRIGEEEVKELAKVIATKQLFRSGDPKYGHLQEVDNFEKEWAEKIGTRYALCLSGGGTSALICGLVGMGIGPGDEVIVPGYTFMASAVAVLAVGAIPVIAEIDESLTIDPHDIEKKISQNTRAIMPVHMVGFPSDLGRIVQISRIYNLKIIEDACQADGGSYKGKRLGSWGEAGAFSFNYFKIIACGEGGALVTNERKIYEKALVYHDAGASFRPFAEDLTIPIFVGLQLRASEIMGAILRIQLQRMDGILSDLRRSKRMFLEELTGNSGISFARSNDPDGDCGVVVAFQFETEREARSFAGSEGIEGWLPIDSDKHVYSNWTPVLEKRAGPNSALNPFNLTQNQTLNMNYLKDMCPKTLDILSRTVFVSLDPDWSEEEVRKRISCCKKAVQRL